MLPALRHKTMQAVKMGKIKCLCRRRLYMKNFKHDAVCFYHCFIKPVATQGFPFLLLFFSSNHQSVSDSFPDQSEDGKGCCVPEVSWQLTRQSQFPTPPLFMSEGGGVGWGGEAANVNGRSNVNYLYASESAGIPHRKQK